MKIDMSKCHEMEKLGLCFILYLHTYEAIKATGIPFGVTTITDENAKGNNQLNIQKSKV